MDPSEEAIGELQTASLLMRVQKKVLSKMSTRAVAKHFVSDATVRLLDNIYRLLKLHYSKSTAEKVCCLTTMIQSIACVQIIKNVLKIAVKLRLLASEEKLTKEQQLALAKLHQKLRSVALTILSFARVR